MATRRSVAEPLRGFRKQAIETPQAFLPFMFGDDAAALGIHPGITLEPDEREVMRAQIEAGPMAESEAAPERPY